MISHDIAEAISLASRIIVLSKRPAHIKKEYKIDFQKLDNPIERRKTKEFLNIYDKLWKDLDDYV